MKIPGAGPRSESLPSSRPGRQAEPLLPFRPGVPPSALWAAALRLRAGSGHLGGGPVSHRRCTRSAAATPTGPRPALAVPRALLHGSKLVDCSAVSCGCRRADRDVRQAARMMTAAELGANRCRCPALCALGSGHATARAESVHPRGGHVGPPQRHQIRGGHAYRPTTCACGTEGPVRRSDLVDGSSVSCGGPAGRSRRAPGGAHDDLGAGRTANR
jgi:hypothetical protein